MEMCGQLQPFYPAEISPSAKHIEGFVCPRAGLGVIKERLILLSGIKLRLLGRPARSLVSIPTELCPTQGFKFNVLCLSGKQFDSKEFWWLYTTGCPKRKDQYSGTA
jgi:hypothetical protein